MSLDQRLRQELRRSVGECAERAEEVADLVMRRGRRRRHARRVAIGAASVVLGTALAIVAPAALHTLRRGDITTAATPTIAGTIASIAGDGTEGASGDGGPAVDAQLAYPVDVATDIEGNLYILENFPGRVRRVDPTGTISTVFGDGAPGEAGIPAAGPPLSATGLDVDTAGNMYIAQDDTDTVLRVDPSGDVTVIAGSGESRASGDGGPATEAGLGGIWDVAVDGRGNIFITGGHRVRKVDPAGMITTIAGSSAAGYSGDGGPAMNALLDRPTGIAVDDAGNVYVLDYGNDRIRRIDRRGIITTVAGPGPSGGCVASGDGGPAIAADLCGPEHLAVDASGAIYVADTGNDRIRRIAVDGTITTVAGTGVQGFSGDGGPAIAATLSEPSGVLVGQDGTILVADSGNSRVRRVTR